MPPRAAEQDPGIGEKALGEHPPYPRVIDDSRVHGQAGEFTVREPARAVRPEGQQPGCCFPQRRDDAAAGAGADGQQAPQLRIGQVA